MDTTSDTPKVVVGIDGSPDSRIALEWAVDPDKGLGEIRTLTAYNIGPFFDGLGMAPSAAYSPEIFRGAAEERAHSVLNQVDPSLVERHRTVQGSAGRCLVEAAEDADLLVVGCRGRSAAAEILLGSVGSYCVKHARVPVAIVPETAHLRGPLSRLVVGVDGSDNSRAALRWALDHVDSYGKVVAMGTFAMMFHAFNVPEPPEPELIAQMTDVVTGVVEAVATPKEAEQLVEIDVHAGDPRMELRLAGEKSSALVVGSRGHRGVAHLLLGSTATSLAQHPTSVTIVVPD
ncbi:MAG: universal stress protein [Acidimicrobiales bacterium]